MKSDTPIRLLETDSNKRGDLFTILSKDLFLTLGYDQFVIDANKGAYELDIKGPHTFDKSFVVAECKATVDKPGGPELNKFFGVLDAEQRRDKDAKVNGYFVSLYGFKDNAVESERGLGGRFVMLDGLGVVEQLIDGQRLCKREVATDQAGRCVGKRPELKLAPYLQLVAHKRGLFWVVLYTTGAVPSHFIFVAADGTPALRPLAEELIAADKACGGELHTLQCLNPGLTLGQFSSGQLEGANKAWREYLEHECGFIHIEGIAADADVATRRFQLEQLFVPQLFIVPVSNGEPYRDPIAKILSDYQHVAILAAPGGGKSTLLKRLAVAYADPSRRAAADDHLPDQNWFPIFLRCRDLRDLARRPFGDILLDLAKKPHLVGYSDAFVALAHDALKNGQAIILIDGLDEISDDSSRAAFVSMLRASIDAWPGCKLVVTSREAGFRHVAAHLAPFCQQVTLAPLSEGDIKLLANRWHVQVEGDSAEVRQRAEELANKIIANNRIQQLAENPLLLTTLFLVKRQTGDLPTGRTKLYSEAVKVLLWSWNVEGHERMEPDDANPRLAWVAHAMMVAGDARISRPKLRARLHEANGILGDKFGLRQLDPGQFIDRVEYRSSLLMMTGKDAEDGKIEDFYEFRHLTFQEYLTAVACVEGYHFGRQDEDTLTTVLEPYLGSEKWKEVIPLAAVLGKKETAGLLGKLMEGEWSISTESSKVGLLIQCLADEAPASEKLIQQAYECLSNVCWKNDADRPWGQLFRGRYGEAIRRIAAECLTDDERGMNALMILNHYLLGKLEAKILVDHDSDPFERAAKMIAGNLPESGSISNRQTVFEGGVLAMQLWHHHFKRKQFQNSSKSIDTDSMRKCADAIGNWLWSGDIVLTTLSAWAFCWMTKCDVLPKEMREWINSIQHGNKGHSRDWFAKLFNLAYASKQERTRYLAVWALISVPLVANGRDTLFCELPDGVEETIATIEISAPDLLKNWLKIIVCWYRKKPFTDAELIEQAVRFDAEEWELEKTRDEFIRLTGADPETEKAKDRKAKVAAIQW